MKPRGRTDGEGLQRQGDSGPRMCLRRSPLSQVNGDVRYPALPFGTVGHLGRARRLGPSGTIARIDLTVRIGLCRGVRFIRYGDIVDAAACDVPGPLGERAMLQRATRRQPGAGFTPPARLLRFHQYRAQVTALRSRLTDDEILGQGSDVVVT